MYTCWPEAHVELQGRQISREADDWPHSMKSEMSTWSRYLESTKGLDQRSFTGNGGLTKLTRDGN